MKKQAEHGKLEYEILRHVVHSGPASVGEVTSSFGEERGYARSTVQTIMERLRKKNLLDRQDQNGTYVYFSRESKANFLMDQVRGFVRDNLHQDISPIVAFLAESQGLSAEEISVLKGIAAKFDDFGGGYV